jgi:hypothetical protein
MNKDFTVTFWIRSHENSQWSNINSLIKFPTFKPNDSYEVTFLKEEKFLNVLTKDLVTGEITGYRVNIVEYLGSDMFVALTYSDAKKERILYLNGSLVKRF